MPDLQRARARLSCEPSALSMELKHASRGEVDLHDFSCHWCRSPGSIARSTANLQPVHVMALNAAHANHA
jgi:hypothetical protein